MDDQIQPTDPEDTLRALATRLLAFRFGSMAREAEEAPRLLVGELPPDLPLALPVPEGARILGAFLGPETIVALETELDADAVIAFYAERMTALGWDEQDPVGGRQGGFVHSFARSNPMMNFSREEGGPVFTVMAGWAADGRSTVQITFHPEGNGDVPRQRRQQHGDIMSLFPAIRAPKRARQTPQGGGGSLDAVNALARLECDLDLAAVAPHYRAELKRGGWHLMEDGASGPVAWSTWTFRDDENANWSAALLILDRPTPSAGHNYVLQLFAERVPEPRVEGGERSGRVTVASNFHSTYSGGWTTMSGPAGRREP